jgi:hypothetical protein
MRLVYLPLMIIAGANCSQAVACSCAGSDLQGEYESSQNVFTAVVTGARFDEDGDIEADFEVTEVFKGNIPFDKLRSGRGTSCDTSITVGLEYLFFMGGDGQFGMCSGNVTIVSGEPTPWLEILQAYKAGEIPDLSSPWTHQEYDGICTLSTDFRSTEDAVISYLNMEYRYAAPLDYVSTVESQNEAGYSSAVFMLPTRKEPVDAQLTLITANREFAASWSEGALPGRDRGVFQVTGEDVKAFAQELLLTTEVQVEGSLYRYPTLDGTVIRTTNAGKAIVNFLRCASR